MVTSNFSGYDSLISKYQGLLETGYRESTNNVQQDSAYSNSLFNKSNPVQNANIDQILNQRVSQRQQLFKQLSDTQLSMKLCQDSITNINVKIQELSATAGNEQVIAELQAEKTNLQNELANLQESYSELSSYYNMVSSQQTAYNEPAKLSYLTKQYDPAAEQQILQHIEVLKQQNIELAQQHQSSAKTPESILEFHKQDTAYKQEIIKLEEVLNYYAALAKASSGTNSNTRGYIDKYTNLITGPNSFAVQREQLLQRQAYEKQIMQQQMMQQQMMQQQMMGQMMGMVGSMFGSSTESTVPQDSPSDTAATVQTALTQPAQQQQAVNPMAQMMQMMMGMFGMGQAPQQQQQAVNPMAQMMQMMMGMFA